jgi:hypothetical protein
MKMKNGKTLTELASTLENLKNHAHDYVVPVEKMRATAENDAVTITIDDGNGGRLFFPNAWAHQQISTFTDVPKGYYDRLNFENTMLLTLAINHGLNMAAGRAKAEKKVESRMLRTIGTDMRALVSPRYRRLDCYDLLETVFPVMIDGGLKVVSSELTERRMYIKAVSDKLTTEVKKGDVVQYGLVISSSDVGAGSVRVEPLINRLVCTNGMIMESAIRKYHIGKHEGFDEFQELLSDKTKELSDAAFWAQIRDVVIGSMKREIFEAAANSFREAAGMPITNFELPKVVELAMKHTATTGEKVKESIVSYLANGADGAGLNKWGLSQAFGWAAQQDGVDYDTSTDLERAAGKIIELPRNAWKIISEKAA